MIGDQLAFTFYVQVCRMYLWLNPANLLLFFSVQTSQRCIAVIDGDCIVCFQAPTFCVVLLEPVYSLDSTNSRSCMSPGVWRSNFVLDRVRLDWDTMLQATHNRLSTSISNNFTLHC